MIEEVNMEYEQCISCNVQGESLVRPGAGNPMGALRHPQNRQLATGPWSSDDSGRRGLLLALVVLVQQASQ